MSRPDFLIIGAQKCGTTWLWEVIKQHPGVAVGKEKEIYYFSASNNYRKGREWYEAHFRKLDTRKLLGEASTDYFYDRVLINNLRVDYSFPPIPELVKTELPDAKILVVLRDPVKRAISSYYHHLQYRRFPPNSGIVSAARKHPSLRIIERGYYARYMALWRQSFQKEQMHCLLFEEDILKDPQKTSREVYAFLGLDSNFEPKDLGKSKNKSWGWSHLLLNYYLGPLYGYFYRGTSKLGLAGLLGKLDKIKPPKFKLDEIEYLRSLYFPEKQSLEALLGRDLSCWHYSD